MRSASSVAGTDRLCEGRGGLLGEELGDLAERAQRSQVLGLDHRRLGQAVLHGREDLDSLDRINAQVRVKLHVELEHVDRVARLVGHDGTQRLGDLVAGFAGCGCGSGNGSRNRNR